MSSSELEFIKEIKLLIVKALISFAGIILISSTAFYFTTNNRLSNLEKETQQLESKKADRKIMEIYLRNINNTLNEIKTTGYDNKRGRNSIN